MSSLSNLMQQCIVVSDNHGDQNALVDLLSLYNDTTDLFLHCGDSEAEEGDLIWKKMYTVKGNMDAVSSFPLTQTIQWGPFRLFMTHGHLYGVKRSLEELTAAAFQEQADIVLFGHSHIPFCQMKEGTVFLNPGSIALPKGPDPKKSYAILTYTPEELRVQYFDDRHLPISGSSVVFERDKIGKDQSDRTEQLDEGGFGVDR